jgi:hypothetical protein
MKSNIPTEEDWGEYYHDRDQLYAHGIFFGRSNEEMQKEFAKDIALRTTDLKFMPKVPFMYYMIGFNDFVISNSFNRRDAPDVANCFITLIEEKLKNTPDHIISIMDRLLPTVEHIANNQDAYNASYHIYGDFMDNLKSIKELLNQHGKRGKLGT